MFQLSGGTPGIGLDGIRRGECGEDVLSAGQDRQNICGAAGLLRSLRSIAHVKAMSTRATITAPTPPLSYRVIP